MLVLSRKLHESIVIGQDVVIQIVDIGHGKVKVGITAPPDVRAMRAELLDRNGNEVPRA